MNYVIKEYGLFRSLFNLVKSSYISYIFKNPFEINTKSLGLPLDEDILAKDLSKSGMFFKLFLYFEAHLLFCKNQSIKSYFSLICLIS